MSRQRRRVGLSESGRVFTQGNEVELESVYVSSAQRKAWNRRYRISGFRVVFGFGCLEEED